MLKDKEVCDAYSEAISVMNDITSSISDYNPFWNRDDVVHVLTKDKADLYNKQCTILGNCHMFATDNPGSDMANTLWG